jgi:hypothetical protein
VSRGMNKMTDYEKIQLTQENDRLKKENKGLWKLLEDKKNPNLLELDMLICEKCGVFWWDFEEQICPDRQCKGKVRKILMREVK